MQPLKPMPVKPARILVVEDEFIVVRDLQLQIRELGYEFVGHATEGEFAVRLAGELRPDLVLMDVQLIGAMDGITAAQAIRTQFGLPVVFLTAFAEDDIIARAKLTEPFGYILKPFSERDLRVGIEMALYKHQTDAKLRLSEARFRAIVEAEPECVKVVAANGDLLEMNAAGLAMLEAGSVDEVNSHGLVGFIRSEYREAFGALHRSVIGGNRGLLEFEVTGLRGTRRWLEIHAAPLPDADGRVLLMLGITRDITARKEAEKEKAVFKARQHEIEKMEFAGRLVGGITHDFNNLLGVILLNIESAMTRVDTSQPLHAELSEIRQAAQSSVDLTQQLLAYARVQPIEPKVLDLNQAVTSLLKMLRRLIGKEIRLVWQAEAKLWLIKMDPSQFDQILINLFVNARDAIDGVGEITIEAGNCVIDEEFCANHEDAAPGEYVRLVVRDNGRGMEKETLACIFEPFFTTKRVGKGTGLGLATVLGAVRQNLGFLTVSSEPGKGTVFSIYLPRLVLVGNRVEPAQKKGPDEVSLRGSETILLVEDEPAVLKVATKLLEARGYTVLGVDNPAEAIRLAKDHSIEIHLLLTDVIMPEINGLNLANTLTSLRPHLKRMFMSGYTADIITNRGELDEGLYFIQKPFTGDGLAAKVREVLDSGGA